ncbi:M20 family metallopeptidase [Leekyejoonella antrihumi]|uniref:M20 family metallopeptidase n=1 Tax=Leekyejoonella antrihumi TaxID=1660198 RepID=A0A563DSM8_9MICO|nr:M20/M25/M40 family metallo-hydrolase [Leekyejoonella antrihumi]TWP33179.1 M20 family metallopeptidase [Leekyejoonella antrihumi]
MSSLRSALELTRSLVRCPSVSGDHAAQAAIQHLVADYAAGGAVRVTQSGRGEAPWTLLETGEDPPGSVLFACHTDTVPLGEPSRWLRDPVSGEIDANHLHGRGSVDMKGGTVAAVHAVIAAAEAGASARLLMTSDEEIGCRGAAEAAPHLTGTPSLIVVPEATMNRVALGHRGATWLRLTAAGTAAHGSTPQRGINAIRLLVDRVITALDDLPLLTDDYLGTETANLGTVTGGTAPNIVPDTASLTLDLRTVGSNHHLLDWAAATGPEINVATELDLPAVRTPDVPDALEDYGVAPPVTYFTDASVLAGVFPHSPIVIFGPGDPTQMHAVDEHLDLASWRQSLHDFVRLTVTDHPAQDPETGQSS